MKFDFCSGFSLILPLKIKFLESKKKKKEVAIIPKAFSTRHQRQKMSSLKSPAPIIKQLRSLLQDLNESLDPVTSQSLEKLTNTLESRTKASTSSSNEVILSGRLESAQLQSSLAYVLLDLVWILLKVDGTNPASHPVTAELKRVQQYLEKVHKMDSNIIAANGQQSSSSHSHQIDQAKASRFIKGALGSNNAKRSTGKRTVFAEDGTVEKVVPVGSEEAEAELGSESENIKIGRAHV